MRTLIKWLVILVFGGLFLLLVSVSRTPLGGLVRNIPFGWLSFLQRHFAEMTVNWVMVTTGLVLGAVVLCGGHWLLGTLYRQARQRRDPNSGAGPWPWRWTLGLFTGFWLLFAVAFGATGAYRQTVWLSKYPDHWYEERLYPWGEFRQIASEIEMYAAESAGAIDAIKKALANNEIKRWRGPIFEDYSVILYAKPDHKMAAFIIIPRKQKMLKFGQFASTATPDMVQPLTELEATLRKFDQDYPIKR